MKNLNQMPIGDPMIPNDDCCDLDPDKLCDNCMKCVTNGADFSAISISGITLEHEQADYSTDED